MKIVCDICKTEYNPGTIPAGAVRCAVCGHIWTPRGARRHNAIMMFIASVCALLATVVFSIAVIARQKIDDIQKNPLVANVVSVDTVTGEDGVAHYVVRGTVTNRSEQIYGVPDLWIIGLDDDDKPVTQQRFMPSATLLDAGASVSFEHKLTAPTDGIKKIVSKLSDIEDVK